MLHCPATRRLCSRGERKSGGRGIGLRCSLLSVVTATARSSRHTWQELSPPQFTGVDTEAQLPSSLEPDLVSNTILVLLPAQNAVGPDSPLRVFNSAFSLLCRRGSELPCAHPLLLALFSSLKEASASETSLCPTRRAIAIRRKGESRAAPGCWMELHRVPGLVTLNINRRALF